MEEGAARSAGGSGSGPSPPPPPRSEPNGTPASFTTAVLETDQRATTHETLNKAEDESAKSRSDDDSNDADDDVLEAGLLEDEDVEGDSADENESLYEEFLNQDPGNLEALSNSDPQNFCSPEQATYYRKRLYTIGLDKFVQETVTANTITAKKLCTAFGVNPPSFLEGQPDTAYYRILGLALVREYTSRRKLEQYNTLDDVVDLLKASKNIAVITGAGISTNLGIPDFRSQDTGFYAQMRAKGFSTGEDVFDIRLFEEDPTIFFDNCADTLPKEGVTSPTHQFIRLLQDKEKLLTNYTQNIDNIEENAGISLHKLIQCHGSWATATCRKCGNKVPGKVIMPAVRAGQVPECNLCKQRLAVAPPLKRKRSSNSAPRAKNRYSDDDDDDDEAYDIPQPGIMKPDITFFGEQLPNHFFDRFRNDVNVIDLVLVIGTSMKVAPVSEIPSAVPGHVPHIYISRDRCAHINFDVTLLGDCDTIVTELARRAGWELKHSMVPVHPVQIDVQSWEDNLHIWTIKRQPANGASLPGEKETVAKQTKASTLPVNTPASSS